MICEGVHYILNLSTPDMWTVLYDCGIAAQVGTHPHTSHTVTYHTLTYSTAVILQPFFKMSTSQYFKMHYQPAHTQVTPSHKPPPQKSPPQLSPSKRSLHPKSATPTAAMMSTSPPRPPVSRQTSCPEPHPLPPSPVTAVERVEEEGTPTVSPSHTEQAESIDGK